MVRLSPLSDPSDAPDDVRDAVAYVIESRGRVPGPSGVLLRTPAIGRAFSDICGELQDGDTVVAKALLELAMCVVGRTTDSAVIWESHSRRALKAGASAAAVDAIQRDDTLRELGSDEATVIAFAREASREPTVSDATFDAAVARFSERGVAELTAAVGAYLMAACVIRVARLEPRR